MEVISIYTDGACSDNPGPGGWAAIFSLPGGIEVRKGFAVKTTNNRMELIAVINAFMRMVDMKKRLQEKGLSSTFTIYSDSAYVVNALNNKWIDGWVAKGWKTAKGDPVKNRDLWEVLAGLVSKATRTGTKVKVQKVKGHNGDAMNEYADQIAKEQVLQAKRALADGRRDLDEEIFEC